MDNIAIIIITIVLSCASGGLVMLMLQRRRINSSIMKLQAEITLSVQASLREVITSFREQVTDYETRVHSLENENRRLVRKVLELDRLFETVLAGAWTLYRQVENSGKIPLFTPPKQYQIHLEDENNED
jgi:ABC-type molybdate transport system substrate-binding protein